MNLPILESTSELSCEAKEEVESLTLRLAKTQQQLTIIENKLRYALKNKSKKRPRVKLDQNALILDLLKYVQVEGSGNADGRDSNDKEEHESNTDHSD
ncbi:uncharacterized protein SAPINGB_P002530 [Magnusiomyces paraingens]|uniref:Uncharacterized protein n=1 Tax=Magnusiomyces paraingens TaxID=2606893 RepID=A0A5E8BEM8_9ASCO|nr:uncharacterized protein SAPINGB_P002530 [Saprochaete ingens]VVT49959.1 unnamed protein product [Saprochaete ingens]